MAAPSSKKRTHCFTNQEPIDVIVGSEHKTFKLYPSLLSSNSKVFAKALSEPWLRATQNNNLHFTFLDVDAFNHYINWCNLGDLDLIAQDITQDIARDNAADDRFIQLCHVLAEIYIMADILDDKVLRNAVIDKILECAATRNYRSADGTVFLAFDSLPESSTLCRFMIDDALSGIDSQWLKERMEKLPREYLDALLLGWAEKSIDKNVEFARPVDVPRCTYHEHDEEVPVGEKCGSSAASKETPAKVSPGKLQLKRKR